MHCPQCHADNPDLATACLACGTSLVLTCPQCGTELPPQANFCFHCGHTVTAPAAEPDQDTVALLQRAVQRLAPQVYTERLLATRGQVARERRIVTMLFCDVQGSTSLAERLDPEEMMDVMDGAFDVLIPPIYRYEGTVARLMGDAVLAFFGAPIAHEDDPACACRAALDIVEQAQGYAEKLHHERGLAGFNVRVGIHTGPVVVGEVGSDLRVEYTAIGDAVNLAQRLQATAEPGQVLISADTQGLVAPWFETEALGEMALRGRSQAVAVYRVVAAKAVRRKPRGIAGLDSPLVGREAEMAALQGAIQRLREGQGGIVTIVGEAGIGKSRLVAEARKGVLPPRCHPEGTEGSSSSEEEKIPGPYGAQNDKLPLRWVEGRCLSYSGSIAYQLWTDVLRHLLAIPSDASPQQADRVLRQQVGALCPQRLEAVYPYLARILALPLDEDTEDRLAEFTGEQIRAATFDAVQTLIECAARQGPLVLVCEDIYWSDPTSMELLKQLLPLTEKMPLLLIAVFRPRREHPSWRVREIAARDCTQHHTDLWLSPLSEGHSQELVANLLPMPAVPETLQQRILERAEGNPFYVEEIIRALIAQGALAQDGSGWWTLTRDVAEIALPETLNGVLTARIDQLPDADRHVLQMAAVIGRLFTYPVLAAIARLDGQLEPHLVALQEAELIRERAHEPEREYIFKHELTREAAYNGLLKKERRLLHRQVAEALEQLFAERIGEQLGLLAHHWERAGDADKAIDYSLRAGDQARLIYANQEAITYYQRAVALLKEKGAYQAAARAMMRVGLTHHSAFQFDKSRKAYEEGFALWQRPVQAVCRALPPAPHPLRLADYDPQVLDPALMQGSTALTVIQQLFSGLAELTPEMDAVPDVAKAWEVLEGGRRYVFHLRDDVCWTDGAPLTAYDFAYAWRRLLDPVIHSPHASLLFDIRGAEAFHAGELSDPQSIGIHTPEARTLVVELRRPMCYFPHLLAHPVIYPVPRHVVQAYGEGWAEPQHIVGNGPFRLGRWQRGRSLTLLRNRLYHGRATGNLEQVQLDLSWEDKPAALLELYESDRTDVYWGGRWSGSDIDRIRQQYAAEYITGPDLTTRLVIFDARRPPFDDARVRRAFVLATDRTRLANELSGGYEFPATGGFVPPGMPGHSPGIGLPYDVERAQQSLARAGYPDGRGFPEVRVLSRVFGETEIEHHRSEWSENLGVQVLWEMRSYSGLNDGMATGAAHLYFLAWGADYPDPASILRDARELFVGWKHEAYDRLVDEAASSMEQSERIRLYKEADSILMEEAPIMPLTYLQMHMLVKPWVTQYPTSGICAGGGFWKDVVLEPH